MVTSEITEFFFASWVQIQMFFLISITWTKRKWHYSLFLRVYHLGTYWYHFWQITVTIRSQSWFVCRIDKSMHWKVKSIKFDLSRQVSEFLDKIPVRIILGVLFRVLRFSKASHNTLKLRRHVGTETYGTLPWRFCNLTHDIIYTTTWKISAIWLAESSGISA